MYAKAATVGNALRTLFHNFRTSRTVETEWARRLVRLREVTDEQIAAEIAMAIALYCPNLPDDRTAMVMELLSAAMRTARRDEQNQAGAVELRDARVLA